MTTLPRVLCRMALTRFVRRGTVHSVMAAKQTPMLQSCRTGSAEIEVRRWNAGRLARIPRKEEKTIRRGNVRIQATMRHAGQK